MYDIKNLNIWKKEEPGTRGNNGGLRSVEITELNLSPRSFNSLKRANCNTVGDILDMLDEEGNGLRRIRNLGVRSENEILHELEVLRREYRDRPAPSTGPVQRLVKPAHRTLDRPIDDFHLSGQTRARLKTSGIVYVRDLYAQDMPQEPGWFAVRELFEQILKQ